MKRLSGGIDYFEVKLQKMNGKFNWNQYKLLTFC
jgi:hypothetical protein